MGEQGRMVPAAGIVAPIDDVAARDPDRVAVIDHGRRITYRTLTQASRRAAAWLLRTGIAPGDGVGLTLRQEYPHLVMCLALLRLGCVQVSLASHEPMAMRATVAARLGLAVMLGDEAADALPGVALLNPEGRFAITAAADLYQAILSDIEVHDHNVFNRRAHVGTAGKARRLPRIWWRSRRLGQ